MFIHVGLENIIMDATTSANHMNKRTLLNNVMFVAPNDMNNSNMVEKTNTIVGGVQPLTKASRMSTNHKTLNHERQTLTYPY
jgi:hypothetical protein